MEYKEISFEEAIRLMVVEYESVYVNFERDNINYEKRRMKYIHRDKSFIDGHGIEWHLDELLSFKLFKSV